MERNQKSSKGVCEKLYKALSSASPFRRHRRVSQQQDRPIPPGSNLLSTTPNPPINKATDTMPISFDFSTHPGNGKSPSNGEVAVNVEALPHTSMMVKSKPKVETQPSGGSDLNNRFSAYIDQVRNRLRTTSTHAESEQVEMDEEEKSHLDEKANEYIRHARVKIRTTSSSVGSAKSFAYKSRGK